MAELIQYANGVPGIRFTINKAELRIGRSEESNDICIPDGYVSKEHALIEARVTDRHSGLCEFVLRDLGSTNSTYVNREKVSTIRLKNNDMIYVGRNMFRFLCEKDEVMGIKEFSEISDTIEFSAEGDSQNSRTFSRRLRMLGVE
ncbi:MAG: FHA domain-containing protein [Gammaproteobacteria bacterium]|nr:FHA domain-containing protein [Gammaproteobacteria bacterium]